MKKIFLTLISLTLLTQADYFLHIDDICETLDTQECENDKGAVIHLQHTLNQEVKAKLKVDGTFGTHTKEAVIKFQQKHHITPSVGYVGPKTKKVLHQLNPNLKRDKSKPKVCGTGNYIDFKDFTRHINLKKSYKVYTNKKLLKKSNKKNTKIVVDVSEQRVKLLVNKQVALCSPCTTGAKRKFEPNTKIYRDKHTPFGNYKIMEKIKNKRSNIFGNYYRKGKHIYHGDRRKYRGSKKGLKYVGASLENWMRITGGGIGLHASKYVKRYPGTNGCIRLPKSVSKTIFKHVYKGTPVKVQR